MPRRTTPIRELEEPNMTRTTGMNGDKKRISTSSLSMPEPHFLRDPMTVSVPTTIPILKTFEPNTSLIEKPGVPLKTENVATKSSGMLVITQSTAKPIDASLGRVSLISCSIDLVAT